MRALRLSLIGTTVVLAALDIFLAARILLDRRDLRTETRTHVELQQRVARLSEAQGQGEREAAAQHESAAQHDAAAQHEALRSEASAPIADAETGATPLSAKHRESLQRELKERTDPQTRQSLIREKQAEERNYYAGLSRELRLSPEESAAVFDVLAEQQIDHEVRSLRKMLAGNDYWVDDHALEDETQRRLELILGPARMAQFLAFKDRVPERRRLRSLQARLGSDSLTRDELARLETIMRQERLRLMDTVRALGKGVRFETGYPENARRRDTDRAGQLRFDEEQNERVAQHYARIRDQAATFLTPEQVRRLSQLQEGRLISARRLVLQRRRVDAEVLAMRREAAQR